MRFKQRVKRGLMVNPFLLFLLCFSFQVEASQTPQLLWPVSCQLNQNCWIVHHVDVNKNTQKSQDYACGSLTYEAHKGTDIAVQDLHHLERGIDILAALGGTVLRVRNDMKDHAYSKIQKNKTIETFGRDCGNGVVIDHGQGWQTQYCHMKQNSILVKPGQNILPGRKLGEMGLSGKSEFAHLHFALRQHNQVIDPFTGMDNQTGCGQKQNTLWSDPVIYQPVSLYAAGFSPEVPVYEALLQDSRSLEKMAVSSPVLTFWTLIYGTQKNDEITLKIIDPDGALYQKSQQIQAKNRIRQFYYTGKRNRTQPLKTGIYKGIVTLRRQQRDGTIFERKIQRRLTVQ